MTKSLFFVITASLILTFLQMQGRWLHFLQGSLGHLHGDFWQTLQVLGSFGKQPQGLVLQVLQTSGAKGSPSHSGSIKSSCAFTKSNTVK